MGVLSTAPRHQRRAAVQPCTRRPARRGTLCAASLPLAVSHTRSQGARLAALHPHGGLALGLQRLALRLFEFDKVRVGFWVVRPARLGVKVLAKRVVEGRQAFEGGIGPGFALWWSARLPAGTRWMLQSGDAASHTLTLGTCSCTSTFPFCLVAPYWARACWVENGLGVGLGWVIASPW